MTININGGVNNNSYINIDDHRPFKVNGETGHVRFAVGFDRYFPDRHCPAARASPLPLDQ